jgi:hypothetical protein
MRYKLAILAVVEEHSVSLPADRAHHRKRGHRNELVDAVMQVEKMDSRIASRAGATMIRRATRSSSSRAEARPTSSVLCFDTNPFDEAPVKDVGRASARLFVIVALH